MYIIPIGVLIMEPIFVGMAEELKLDQPDLDIEELLKEEDTENVHTDGNDGSTDSPRDGEGDKPNS